MAGGRFFTAIPVGAQAFVLGGVGWAVLATFLVGCTEARITISNRELPACETLVGILVSAGFDVPFGRACTQD